MKIPFELIVLLKVEVQLSNVVKFLCFEICKCTVKMENLICINDNGKAV